MSPRGRFEARMPSSRAGAPRQAGRIIARAAAPLVCAAAIALAACGEKTSGAAKKSDVPAYQGSTGASGYVADGWKAGDQAGWEQQLRNRAQSQNEYTRTGAKP